MPTESWESMQNLNCEKIQELLGVGSLHDGGKYYSDSAYCSEFLSDEKPTEVRPQAV